MYNLSYIKFNLKIINILRYNIRLNKTFNVMYSNPKCALLIYSNLFPRTTTHTPNLKHPGNFGAVFIDQSYWQCGVASYPISSFGGFIIGGVIWFALPLTFGSTMGLAYRFEKVFHHLFFHYFLLSNHNQC